MKNQEALVIIPCFNEEQSIIDVVKAVKKTKIPGVNLDYLVINDGSSDNTVEKLNEAAANYLNLAVNSGIGTCVQTGYQYAWENDYDFAIQLDGDGQHDAREIEKILKPLLVKRADLVIGSRFINGQKSKFQSTFARRIGISFLSGILRLFSGKKIKDVTSGFRSANKDVIEYFAKEYPREYPEPVTDLILARNGYRIVEVPVSMRKRLHGKSSITLFKSVYYMINVTFLFFIILLSERKQVCKK